MKQVILILADQKFSKNVKKSLTDKFKIEVFTHSSASEAISFLEILPYANIVITDETIGKESTAQKIFDFVNLAKDNLPSDFEIIFLSNSEKKYLPHHTISPNVDINYLCNFIFYRLKLITELPKEIESITEKEPSISKEPATEATTVFQIPKNFNTLSKINIQNILNESKDKEIQEDIKADDVNYFEIDIRLLKTKNEIKFPCQCFTRVKKGDQYEYSLKIEKDSSFGEKEYDKLYIRGIKQLWINDDDYIKSFPIFTKIFVNNITNLNLSYAERLLITSDSFEILLKLIKENKVDQNLVEIIKATLPSYDFFTKLENPLLLFFEALKQTKVSYGLTHSCITCLIMHRVYTNFEWSKDYTKNKINYITFFHDLCLGSEKIIKLHHQFQENKDNLTNEEKITIEKHADRIAKLLERIVKVPKELVALLREHHGALNGLGISENLNLRIYPFTKLLIITEKISYLLIERIELSPNRDFDLSDLRDIFNELKLDFDKPGYQEIFREIESSLLKLEI